MTYAILVIPAMGTMAVDAALLHRGMHMLFCFKGLFLVGVTGITDIVAVCHEEIRVIAFMGKMAETASADCDRPMDKIPFGNFLVMAAKTQVRSFGP